MSAIAFFWHFLGFSAPALFLGITVAAAARAWSPLRLPVLLCMALNTVAALLVQTIAFISTGQDGKVSTYAATILIVAGVQLAMLNLAKKSKNNPE